MADSKKQGQAIQRSELRRALSQLTPKQRIDALIDQPDAKAAIRGVPAEDLYLTIADVGLHDATEIVQLASPQQFRTFVDLAAWKKDRIDSHQVLTWLRAARGDDPEERLKKLHALDVELVESMLREFTRVYELEENPHVNPEGITIETAEGKYLVEITLEGIEQLAVRQMIQDLIAENPFEATRFFESLRWQVPSELEETAFQFRQARLSDLGFPAIDDAMALYTFVDPKTVARGVSSSGALVAPRERPDYLSAAFTGLSSQEQETLEEELRYLVNAALVADAAEPGDLDAIRRTTEQTRDYLSLGFEELTGGNPAEAAALVDRETLKKIFQVGFSLSLQVKFKADRLAKDGLFSVDGTTLFLPEEAAAIAALRRRRPLRALKVEGAEPVPFRSRRELAESSAQLDRAASQRTVFSSLLGGDEQSARAKLAVFGGPLSELGTERLFAAALAWAVLEGEAALRPLPPERLVELGQRLFEAEAPPRLRTAAIDRAVQAINHLAPGVPAEHVREMVERVLGKVNAELGAPFVKDGRVDPQFVQILPVQGQPLL